MERENTHTHCRLPTLRRIEPRCLHNLKHTLDILVNTYMGNGAHVWGRVVEVVRVGFRVVLHVLE